MTSQGQSDAALDRARETVRAIRSIARRLTEATRRDALSLEAVALECLIERIETADIVNPADVVELEEQIDRTLRMAARSGAFWPGRNALH